MTNIAEILANAPRNLKLYSLVHGEVTLKEVDTTQEHYHIDISDKQGDILENLTNDGKLYVDYKDAECILFPSKEHKSWDNWQEVLFQKGDVITVSGGEILLFNSTDYAFTNKAESRVITKDIYRYATPKEREQFMAELNANGYKWNADTKQMEKIKQQYTPKYKVGDWLYDNDHGVIQITDIIGGNDGLYCFNNECQNLISLTDKFSRLATEQELVDAGIIEEKPFTIYDLKPFDKVLVLDMKSHWTCDFYIRYDNTHKLYACITSTWDKCIPYNDETKHLLGTTDDAPKKYKTW